MLIDKSLLTETATLHAMMSANILLQACMAARGFQVLIADESHAMRTCNHAPDARHTEAVAAAAKRARRVMLLTGTPSLSKPFDLFRQVSRPSRCGLVNKETCMFSTSLHELDIVQHTHIVARSPSSEAA